MTYSFLQSHIQRRHPGESEIGMYFKFIKRIERGGLEKCKYSEDVQSMILCNLEEKFLLLIFEWQIPVCVNASATDWYNVLGNTCFNPWKIVKKNLCVISAASFQTGISIKYYSQ